MRSQRIPRTVRGVSLIELMVSLVIGLLLIAGAVTVYLQSRDTYRVNETVARVQEIGRYALDVLEPDVRLAGFWGLTNRADFVENRAGPAETQQAAAAGITDSCGNNWVVDVTQFIDGRDAAATSGAGYNLACSATSPAAWSDVLIVRRASSDVRALAVAPAPARVQIQSNRMRAAIFKDGTLPAGFGAPPASETRDLIAHAYYISDAGAGANGQNQFQLRRQTLRGTSIIDEEVIPGIQDMQVQFGVDTNADGSTDLYANPGAVPAGQITAARVWLLVVADDREPGFVDDTNYAYANATPGVFNDGRRRILMTKTIQIRNSRP